MRLSRRAMLCSAAGGTAVVGVAAADGLCITPYRLEITHHRLGAGRPAPAGADDDDRGRVRVVQVSDLHIKAITAREEAVLAALVSLAPDMIVVTGDSLDTAAGAGPLEDFLAACPRAAARLAILGNWEYKAGLASEALTRLYERHGFDLLVNRSTTIPLVGHAIRVTGLDDLCHGRPDPDAALRGVEPGGAHLILAHCPATRDSLRLPAGLAADALLAGHTHGGQVALGGVCLVTPPGSGRYVAGWYDDAVLPMFVSRGIGTSLVPVRIGARPELALFDWRIG